MKFTVILFPNRPAAPFIVRAMTIAWQENSEFSVVQKVNLHNSLTHLSNTIHKYKIVPLVGQEVQFFALKIVKYDTCKYFPFALTVVRNLDYNKYGILSCW